MRPDGFEAQFFKLSRRATHSAFIGVLDAALDRFEQVTGHLSDPDGDIVPFIVVALGEALWCAELPAPAAEQVEDFVSEVLPELVEQVRAEAVALALPMWMRESDTADRERREVVQLMVASADGRRQTHACEVSRDAGRPPRFAMFMLVAEGLAPVFERALGDGLRAAQGDGGVDELGSVAIGVLGDIIDYAGGGWDGTPCLMLVTPDDARGGKLTALALETQTPAAQLAEIADVFRVELPVACAYVKRLDVTLEERRAPGATLPVVVVLDSEGGKRVIACDEARADDGREILIPLDGVDSSLLPGVFDSFVADALALARLARDGQATTDERWERLLADARDALGR